ILVKKRFQSSRRVETCWQSRFIETHERGKRVGGRCCSEGVLQEQGHETHGLLAKFSSNCRFSARSMVALIKQQIASALDGWKSSRELSGSVGVEQRLQSRQSFLGSRNAFLNRCITRDEGACDLCNTESA